MNSTESIVKNPSKKYKKVNNPNYYSEYYHANKDQRKKYQDSNKLKCEICNIILTLPAKYTHILSSKHKLKLLETGTILSNPIDCYSRIKIDLEEPK